MAARGKYQSLKGKSALWSGVDQRSLYLPLPGTFRELTNTYISSDGTELARVPGWFKVAEPRNLDANAITAVVAGYPTEVRCDGNRVLVQIGDVVRISGSQSTPPIDGDWLVTRQGGGAGNLPEDRFFIPVDTSVGAPGGTVTVSRQRFNHRLRQLLGYVAVAGECSYSRRSLDDSVGPESMRLLEVKPGAPGTNELVFDRPHGHDIGIEFTVAFANGPQAWLSAGDQAIIPNGDKAVISTGPFTATTVAGTFVTGGIRTGAATDRCTSWVRTNLPTFFARKELPAAGTLMGALSVFNYPPRFYWSTYPIETPLETPTATPNEFLMSFVRRKSRCDMSEGKILMTVPGHGLVSCLDLRSYEVGVRDALTTSLGVPQGRILAVTQTVDVNGFAIGTWYVGVAYRIRDSNEIGLMSPPIASVIAGAAAFLNVYFVNPHYLQPELAGAIDILIFVGLSASSRQLVAITRMLANYSLVSGNGPSGLLADTRQPFGQLVVENQPMGCVDSATVRGATLFGGSPGFDYDDPGHMRVYLEISQNQPSPQVRVLHRTLFAGSRFLAAAFRGRDLIRVPRSSSANEESTTFYANVAPTTNAMPWYENIDTDLRTNTAGAGVVLKPSKMALARGKCWVTEQGFPGVTNDEGVKIIDSRWGEDVEAIGTYGDSYVIATRKETYVYGFASSPLDGEPQRVSSRYGAISPMVEFDDGAAWLSDLGPVVYRGNGVEWIGEAVKPIFDLAKRDNKGLMGHSCLGYDREKQLVYFGLRRDVYDIKDLAGTATAGNTATVTFALPHGLPLGVRKMCRISGASLAGVKMCLPVTSTTMTVWAEPASTGGAVTVSTGYETWSNAYGGDDRRSKMGCDFFLVWSPVTGAWTTWQPPAHMADIHDMWPLRFVDGTERLCFLAHDAMDATVYAFDGRWQDTVQTASVVTGQVNSVHIGARTYFESTAAIGTGAPTRVGMGFLVRSSDGATLRGYGHVLGIDSANRISFGSMTTPLVPQTITLEVGDVIAIGLIHARLKTNRFNPLGDDWESVSGIRSLKVRHELETSVVGETGVDAWMAVQAATSDTGTAMLPFTPVKLEGARSRAAAGMSSVREHQWQVDLVGPLRTRLKDIFFEVTD